MKTRALIAILILSCTSAWADSRLPDDDTSGKNNSFEKAINAGLIGEVRGNVRSSFQASDELGVIIADFDTLDVYKFSLSVGEWSVNIALRETPNTTQWLELYNATDTRKPIRVERGGDNDQIIIGLSGGDYFLKVLTDKATAAGRTLKYDLSISAELTPNIDAGGIACDRANDLGKLKLSQDITGSLSAAKNTSAYRFYYPFEFAVAAGDTQNSIYETTLKDAFGGGPWTLTRKGQFGFGDHRTLDPGFYCLLVSDPYATLPKNYTIRLGKGDGEDYRLRETKDKAVYFAMDDIGPITRNGLYKGVRSNKPSGSYPGPEISIGSEYNTREWLGTERRAHWYKFSLVAPAAVRFLVTGLIRSSGIELQDETGGILASDPLDGSTADVAISNLQIRKELDAGTYYVRLFYKSNAGPGTSFQLLTKVQPSGTLATSN